MNRINRAHSSAFSCSLYSFFPCPHPPPLHEKIKQVVWPCWRGCVLRRWAVPQPVGGSERKHLLSAPAWVQCPVIESHSHYHLNSGNGLETSAAPQQAAHMVLAWQPGRRGPLCPPPQTHSHTQIYILKTNEDLNDTSFLYTHTLNLTTVNKDMQQ